MKARTRRLHFIGTTAGLFCLSLALLSRRLGFIPGGLASAYGLAWFGHFFIEKNRPATFQYPLLSFRADLRMYRLMWKGDMEKEMARLRDEISRHLRAHPALRSRDDGGDRGQSKARERADDAAQARGESRH